MSRQLDEQMMLPRVSEHLLADDPAQPASAASTAIQQWDAALLPLELVETDDSLVCTIWLHKVSMQQVQASAARNRLVICVKASSHPGHLVEYHREIELPAPVNNEAGHMMLNGTILTIRLPRAEPNFLRQLLASITLFQPRYSALSLEP